MSLVKQKFYKYILYPLARIYWKIFSPKTRGARALIISENSILLVKNLNVPYWVIPGGGINKKESPEDCIKRELNEELGLENLGIDYKLGEYKSSKEGKRDEIHIFIIKLSSKNFNKKWEIENASWFDLNNLPKEISQAALRRIKEYKEGKSEISDIW